MINRTGSHIRNKKDLLSIYFTADYPRKGSTGEIIIGLQNAGTDLIEVGIPFSDPLADGPVIQQSNYRALENGFSIERLFAELKEIKDLVKIPLVLMGYFNNVFVFGIERFLTECKNSGIDTTILPDLPIEIFEKRYKNLFDDYGVSPVFLISPQTTDARIRKTDKLSNAFIYAVADNTVTGGSGAFSESQLAYFGRLRELNLSVPVMIGFGISDNRSYRQACEFSQGAIIGSAFIRAISESVNLNDDIKNFVNSIKTGSI